MEKAQRDRLRALAAERREATMSDLRDDRLRLAAAADAMGVRLDWHEPDESNVTAELVGDHLDNAFGDSHEPGKPHQEFVFILRKEGQETFRINLATLLAAASVEFRRTDLGA